MYGSIEFETLAEMAEFLGAFAGTCTATWHACQQGTGRWLLTFNGGY